MQAAIADVAKAKPRTADGVVQILKAQAKIEPDFRGLLCFHFEQGQRKMVRQLMTRIRKEVGPVPATVTDIEEICKSAEKAEAAMYKFDHKEEHPEPQIFVLNTRAKSASVQGMDLYNTDLTMVAEGCDRMVERQVVGRILRQRKRPASMDKNERFPPKRLVMLGTPPGSVL